MNFKDLTNEDFMFIDDGLDALASEYFANDGYEYAVKVENLRLRLLNLGPEHNLYANMKGE